MRRAAPARTLDRPESAPSLARWLALRVFISHTFAEDDDTHLAQMLEKELGAAGIDGYLAEKTLRYDLLIHDKICRAIDESAWLVAVITRAAQRSASVHEEIGYALGRGKNVIVMLEEGVKESGVLIYGKEPEVFSPRRFVAHAQKVARFISDAPLPDAPEPERLSHDAEQLLDNRKILSEKSDNFAQNRHFGSLNSGALTDAEMPVVLFTACPHRIAACDTVATDEFVKWAKSITHVSADGHKIPVTGLYHKIDIGSLTLTDRVYIEPCYRDVRSYREFCDNGLFEYGTSLSCVYQNDSGEAFLHLCLLIGNFWGFLLHARLFYQKIGLEGPFTTLLSIRNSSKMALDNYGDEATNPGWRYAQGLSPRPADPHTDRRHIRLTRSYGSVREMTDREIASAARETARKICNAYGQSSPKCYNNERFSWKMWEMVSPW